MGDVTGWFAAFVAVVVSGCIEASIKYCDDSACPVSTTCVDGSTGFSCVDDSLIEACDALADGEMCNAPDYLGVCRAGICIRPTCGDGFARDPEPCEGTDLRDYRCEDLGRYPGLLACTPACTFDRSQCGGYCGDGTRNGPELCEGTDLGGINCQDLGHYGGTLGCTSQCQYDRTACVGSCGDGTINGPETCEGTDLGGHHCGDIARYRGTVSCSNVCGVDYSACAGFCGDAVVDPFNEQCDATVPPGTCVALGYDTGELSCSSCQRSTRTCGDFGWTFLATIGSLSLGVPDAKRTWSNGQRVVAILGDTLIIVDALGTTERVVGSGAQFAVSDAGVAVVHGNWTVERFNGTWTTLPSPTTTGVPGAVDYGDDGTIYAVSTQCQVYVLPMGAMLWTQLGGTGGVACGVIKGYAPDHVWVVGSSEWQYFFTGWFARNTGIPATDFEKTESGGEVLAARPTGLVYVSSGGTVPVIAGSFGAAEIVTGRPCGAGNGIRCQFGASTRTMPPAPGGENSMIASPPDTLAVLVGDRVWTAKLGFWELIDTKASTHIAFNNGAVFVQRIDDHMIDLNSGNALVFSDSLETATVAVVPFGDHWLQINAIGELTEVQRDGAETPYSSSTGGNTFDAWIEGTTLAVVETDGTLTLWETTDWSFTVYGAFPDPPGLFGCAITGFDGRASDELYAVATCSTPLDATESVVFKFSGTAWDVFSDERTGKIATDLVAPNDGPVLAIIDMTGVSWIKYSDGAVTGRDALAGTRFAGNALADLFVYGRSAAGRGLIYKRTATGWVQVRAPSQGDIWVMGASPEALIVSASTLDRLNRFGF